EVGGAAEDHVDAARVAAGAERHGRLARGGARVRADAAHVVTPEGRLDRGAVRQRLRGAGGAAARGLVLRGDHGGACVVDLVSAVRGAELEVRGERIPPDLVV